MKREMKDITLQQLLEAGCHFGHQTIRWNPKMKPYIFAAREGVHIFDLAKTKEGLEAAVAFAKALSASGGKILFVGTKRQAQEIVEAVAKKAGMPYMVKRWLGGTITNWEQIKQSRDKMVEMKRAQEAGEYKSYTKKEQLLFDREIAKLERFLGGLVGMENLPEAIFIVDVKKEIAAALEAQRRGIKVIGVVDTNSDPDLADFVIPANDDAVKSIGLVVEAIGEAVEEGKKKLKIKS